MLEGRILFLNPETEERHEVPIPGTPSPGVPSFMRLWDGNQKELSKAVHEAILPTDFWGMLRAKLFRQVFFCAVPPDIQQVEEASVVEFGIRVCGAAKVFLVGYPVLLSNPEDFTPKATFWRTCRACVVSYLERGGVVATRTYPIPGFGPEQLRAALRELHPAYDAGRTPFYIADPEGNEPLAGEGIPVSLTQLEAHMLDAAAAMSRNKWRRKMR